MFTTSNTMINVHFQFDGYWKLEEDEDARIKKYAEAEKAGKTKTTTGECYICTCNLIMPHTIMLINIPYNNQNETPNK